MLNKIIQNKLSASCASTLIIVTFIVILHTANGLSLAGDRDGRKLFGGYKITPKFCTDAKISKADAKVSGPAICMFNHECVERKGKVIGACMDGFLFGTCCLLSGVVETSLANVKANMTSYQQAAAVMEELATRGPLVASSKPQIINNQFYGTNDDDSSIQVDENIKQELSNDAVMVSSPSYGDRISSPLYYPTKSTSQQSYVTELPNFIQSSSTYFTPDDESNDHNDLIQFSQVPYDHSGISHTSAEADVYSTEDGDDNNIINPYPIPSSSIETRTTETSTQPPQTTSKFSKPIFKPKPTQSSSTTEKYVLVHTITNDKPQSNDNTNENLSTKKPSITNDSIQSIILMLNGTNSSGPEYNVDSMNVNNENTQTTSTYGSTSMIDYDKYGSSSYYVTTKMPERITSVKVPSTSYVYSPNPTRRPTTSTTRKTTEKSKTTTTRSVSKKTSTKKPVTTLNVPSTSYIYSPNPITKRPIAPSTAEPVISNDPVSSTLANKKKTSPKPILVVSTQQHEQIQQHHQQEDIQTNYVVISGGGITKHPSPTVHITPKPITNLLTSSTATQLKQTKPPNELTGQQSSTERPPAFFVNTTPTTFVSSSIYIPGIEDFHNEGYYAVVTQRPGVLSTAIYAVSPGLINTSVGDESKEPENDMPIMTNDDFSNFPPVRNPNLNMTVTNNVQESDISTPSFIEDSQLNNKIDLLVNKLIESMQGNLDNLVDIVYDKKNVSSVNLDNKKKNSTLADTPTTKVPKTTVKQTSPTKPPAKTTTAPPGRPSSQQQTSKRPPAKTSTAATTKKPATSKKPATQKPGAATTSKRPPNRVTSASPTKKPTKKATTTTTTTQAPLEDELLEGEEAPVSEEGGQEETVEEGEESNVVDESEAEQPAATPSGKIQCGVRPQYKKGRIVGGTAAAFGEFPWQVLVRESTWLGLFTKNKCGGVLISNSYVLTAAHCQPGFLASLVAVFGEHDISGELETKRSVTKNVKRVIVHRQYDAATFENDLAILELESPVRYDSHIVPICMPPDGTDYTGKVATVSGWGRLKYGGGVPSVLQEVQVPIIENTVCQDMFEHAGHKKKILPSFLCAGYANGQKDSCEGDSGGPLVMSRPDGRYQLIGTVSHGIKCAAPFLPGVYMRTNFYKPWIKSITGLK